MKRLCLLGAVVVAICSCNPNNSAENTTTTQTETTAAVKDSSVKNPAPPPAPLPVEERLPATPAVKGGTHPISLQWISWDKKGTAKLEPLKDGWFSISGSQTDAEKSYLNIDGKIRRISEKELEFEGSIETRVKYNNGGEPCIKKGTQRFFAKGSRTYFRLQNMENCAGGNLVDYVDIYPGSSSL